MPTNILFRYALPTHHQLLLCLIENKRIENPVLLTSLDLGNLDQLWVNILQSYVYVCYQIGSVCDTGNIRVVPGLSLYPWLTERLGVEVVRMVIQQVQDDDSDDEDIG